MKVAVIFPGYPRFVAECYESILTNLLNNLPDYDIYANFQWNNQMIGTQRIKPDISWNGKVLMKSFSEMVFERDEVQIFKELYAGKIRKIKTVDPMEFDMSWVPEHNPGLTNTPDECRALAHMQKCQFQCLLDAVNLIDDLSEYTHIIRMRTDLKLSRPISPSEILEKTTVAQNRHQEGADRRVSDWFFVCPKEHIGVFEELANVEESYKHGLTHQYLVMEKISEKYPIVEKELGVVLPRLIESGPVW